MSEKISGRFPQDDVDILECLDVIFNPYIYPATVKDIYKAQLQTILEHFDDYEHVVKDRALNHFLMLKHHVHSLKEACGFQDVCRNIIKETNPDFVVFAYLASIPVSSAPYERGFSVQNSLKTNSRNRLNPERLNHLILIKLDGPVPADFNFDKAFELFHRKERRKLA